VSQAVAMKITGHKTASVYRRYRIVDERDMTDAMAKTEAATQRALSQRPIVKLSVAKEAAR
jgi:hypothetical protein